MDRTDDELDAFAAWERETWEARAAAYGAGITDLTRGGAGHLLDAAEVGAGTRVLDVATGPGVVALAARDRGADVVAVDQSEAMVGLARAAGLDARVARADDLPFDDGAFDAVVAGFLVNHLARPGASVAELARVCRGRVAVSVWDVPDVDPALGLFGSVAASFAIAENVPPGPDSTYYADDHRLISLLAGAGLDDVRVDHVSWALTVDPGAWFDAVAAGTPRTGAVLAAATDEQRAALRQRYIEVAQAGYGDTGLRGPNAVAGLRGPNAMAGLRGPTAINRGLVTLPAAAVVGSGRARR